MTAYTPIYNLPYVEASDLVANYPTVSEELAENIETALDGFSAGGLVPLAPTSTANSGGTVTVTGNTVAFSGVTTVSLNGVFSATYKNYRIVMNVTPSANIDGYMRLRAAGSDNTTASSYIAQRLTASSTTVSGARTTADYWSIWQSNTTRQNAVIFDVFDPFSAATSAISADVASSDTGAYLAKYVGTHTQATSYDGFTLYQSSGSITGSLVVYGYAI